MVPGFVYFAIHIGVIICALVYYWIQDGVWHLDTTWLVVAPVAVVLIVAFALAIGLFTSVLGAEARDVRFGLGYVLEFWIYLTPVVYPLAIVPGGAQTALMLNPMAVLVVAFRGAILGGEGPTPLMWASAVGIIGVLLAAGLAFFQRAEAEAVDSL
jgi:lipopolysaccharide transport system permease protein